MQKKTNKDSVDLDRTFKQGVGGGILGAFVGAPGLGMGLGVLHANKDKLQQWTNEFPDNVSKSFDTSISRNNKKR